MVKEDEQDNDNDDTDQDDFDKDNSFIGKGDGVMCRRDKVSTREEFFFIIGWLVASVDSCKQASLLKIVFLSCSPTI